jgi:hypothetical protein
LWSSAVVFRLCVQEMRIEAFMEIYGNSLWS